MLLDRKAKLSATDARGDSALHVAMRSRSRAIVEVLLRNPKHSQLLYREVVHFFCGRDANELKAYYIENCIQLHTIISLCPQPQQTKPGRRDPLQRRQQQSEAHLGLGVRGEEAQHA